MRTLVGDGASLLASGPVSVAATNLNAQLADVAGLSAGFISVGANFATASSNTLTEAVLGDLVKISATSLELIAEG
ncbi:hypothetical protein RZS08_45750, partial [Arthrospira platensis SPKY1]|nr:hypothetical protein [Arthrospira platensis SPKY1]